jgi:RNA polymerase sigma factor (sigma-70 family)
VEQKFVTAAQAGDETAFAALAERYRAELQLHCYRMLGSFQDAEDLVQETLLRGWSKRETYQGRATFRAWLYGIATNACLDALRRRPRRLLPLDVYDAADPTEPPQRTTADVPWLEPFPEHLLEHAHPEGFHYGTFRLDDGLTFIHLVSRENGVDPLPELEAFRRFRDGVRERCDEAPVVSEAQ